MIGHDLRIIRFIDRKTNGVNSPKEDVFVTKDEWTFDKGRYIEFLAIGLPDFFVFAVRQQDNADSIINNDSGDSRFGSWVGVASKIGVNKYQGLQPSGLEREASGMNVIGDTNSIIFSNDGSTAAPNAALAVASLGANMDWAVGYNHAANVGFGPINTRISKPKWGKPADFPQKFRTIRYGSVLDPSTRSIRAGASVVRKSIYDFDGTVVTTNFFPRTNEADITLTVGGATFMPPKVQLVFNFSGYRTVRLAYPISTDGMSTTSSGEGRSVPAESYAIVYTQSSSPYTTTFFRLSINANGGESFVRTTGTPGSDGLHNLSQAITLYTSSAEDVLDNLENKEVLKGMATSMKTKQISYKIKYPTTVPLPYSVITTFKDTYIDVAHSWVIQADFINHVYSIGG